MRDELKKIKKIYGEEMMHLCRYMFPTILEKEGLLFSILEKKLAPTHSLASDIKKNNLYNEFKNWIYSFVNFAKEELILTNKTPFELMDKAGYILYECLCEEDIQKFKKYYARDEIICTIDSGKRLNTRYVFFAVKKNIDKIKREDFKIPQREDQYGTSVISIQFTKGDINTLSIINRYNHIVDNPDATFSNNLENIIPGLTKSFENYYKFNIIQHEEKYNDFINKLNYVEANNGRNYRYNFSDNGIYFCENNIIVEYGNVITKYAKNKERYILINQYLIDRQDKIIKSLIEKDNSFIINSDEIKNIDVIKDGKRKLIYIHYQQGEVIIAINKNNAIIDYENHFNYEDKKLCKRL